ncbi:MAG: Modification methylase MjaV [Candidatus Methanofastidiosum methylothiophilum]|uniref:Type II methyltransferase n=1 Tax=Candidatus Methanofastidiosum methylothiophilum TaxID=1705564 RepID=A0A150J9E0_9EURY|nr:MAG: Modification methylase MjaV [Candidatus Methanofastidiosum methylthiophilus]
MVFNEDCKNFLPLIQDKKIQLIITSPPYNIGKEYDDNLDLEEYKEQQAKIIKECVRTLKDTGSICWQVGTYVKGKKRIPLDIYLFNIFTDLGLKFQNRIIWTFDYGLHSNNRFSGRYETVLWFTKTDDYIFNLDLVRIPQKYPRKKHFKGDKKGKYSCNPLGKNPGDVWYIPNVVHNHPEKTEHPCQFPEALIERLVLSLSNEKDMVLDPFAGSGTVGVVCEKYNREGVLIEKEPKYCDIIDNRLRKYVEQSKLEV